MFKLLGLTANQQPIRSRSFEEEKNKEDEEEKGWLSLLF